MTDGKPSANHTYLPVEGLPSSQTPPGAPYGVGADLPRLRDLAHQVFDQLWQCGYMSRDDAYVWLAELFDLPPDRAHIGKLTRAQLTRLRGEVRDYLRDADHRSDLYARCEDRARRRKSRNDPCNRSPLLRRLRRRGE